LSTSADRSGSVPLSGQFVAGDVFVFISPQIGIRRVLFYLDDPTLLGLPRQIEQLSPYDFTGTAADGSAKPEDTTLLPDGQHVITAVVERTGGGIEVANGEIIVANQMPRLQADVESLSFVLSEGEDPSTQTLQLETSDASSAVFSVDTTAPWLTVIPASGSSTPETLTVSVDPVVVPVGSYSGTVRVTAPGYVPCSLSVTLQVGAVLVDLPYVLPFDGDHGQLLDGAGVGTGFTYVDPPTNGVGYLPANLTVNDAAGVLELATSAGLQIREANSLDNALSVGIDAPSQVATMTTRLLDPPAGSGNWEQGGLWFGNDEDNYVKLIVASTPTGARVQYLMEVNGAQADSKTSIALDLAGAAVDLQLRINPSGRTISGFFRINDGPLQFLKTAVAPPEFFSFDAAGINPAIGTRSFGGIFASHRQGPQPLVYLFDEFAVEAEDLPPPSGVITFDRFSTPVFKPTSLVQGPGGTLYATELLGTIHAITFDGDSTFGDAVISTLTDAIGPRLTLGIAIEPGSVAGDTALWVAHSSPSLNNGVPNSSVVSRLSGTGFTTVEHIITGLPRAKANHSVNSLRFGPDGRLYIAVGGNTGAGAPNTATTEFGDMEEQPLSAAIVVADVFAPGFDGTCHNTSDIFGPAPCDVDTYATGLRNSYDFIFHSNGSMYATDNGLGVTGTFPPSPEVPCFGFGNPAPYTVGGHDPGSQPDLLVRIVEGSYYGHPNPSRGECVFKDGGFQGVQPLPNWRPPTFSLGDNRSTNGIIEYAADAFCGAMEGDLLVSNFSVGDDIMRVQLTADGLGVADASSLVAGLDDPLPLALGPNGVVYVGEFGADQITALVPTVLGCWLRVADVPEAILDAGGTELDGKLYMVGGKTVTEHVSSMFIYDPAADEWTAGPNLPGPAVENPALVALDGLLYAFGGSTEPFSGAVDDAAVFDPLTQAWSPLSPMPTARGGAAAEALGGLIYVVGGIAENGASLDSVEVYDPTMDAWTSVAPMLTRRDNPGAAVFDDKLYVFGGRTRDADGTEVDGTLNTVEMYDPTPDVWTERAPMPTGRRTMVVGTLDGRAQVIGGERAADGKTFPQNEEYDPATDTWRALAAMPTPRHGAAGGTVDGAVYIAGGGPAGGASFTTIVEAFGF
jgi:N-acetylneuraminic acid mutarotase/glucose/arabinose dehydrogenase